MVMSVESDLKRQVREFYDQVGWQEVSEGFYQNASYEDLRPVSREYIHCCHLRVKRHLRPQGRLLLDAGSGPIQYPEYLEYSQGYDFRVCVDISILALQEARKRLGDHGLCAVADVANLPFAAGAFEGIVSLHTIHHLPLQEHLRAYQEIYRLLTPGCRAVVVNGWHNAPLMKMFDPVMRLVHKLLEFRKGIRARGDTQVNEVISEEAMPVKIEKAAPRGTYTSRYGAKEFARQVGMIVPLQVWVWRSLSVQFLRTFIHERWAGRRLLQLVYRLEEGFPRFFGRVGQYPLVVVHKQNQLPSQNHAPGFQDPG